MKSRKANPYKARAAALALLVHLLLAVVFLVSFDWKTQQPVMVAQVELWENLPADKPVAKPPQPEPVPEPPKPESKPEPQPEPKPEPKPEPAPEPEPQAEIQVKKEPEKPKPEKKPEPKKPEKKPEPKKPEPKKPEPKKEDKVKLDELKKLQQELLEENSQPAPAPAQKQGPAQAGANAADQSEIDKYIGQIQAKIKRNVNRQLCGTGKPELEVGISLMPTGEVIGVPRILKSSGLPACDEAIERAILQAQPLPVPSQPELFSRFRDLRLKFRPNEDN
ncbi:TonB C-terminal domain-containing protein [Methylobacillus arboreus]|uniref:energy transducer TonB n=1 Tax=Methylobacillus arboreus TaxID=755170 RepID=UPI001E65AB8E|nr:energy transducer TonB [Methylobacillus arboreus]MCB5190549.1 TonB C-terminal domain-containing protein [Methylobacillus arboreus]